MLLKKLTLKNIRSYDSLILEFREGSTLLSGDIGSGKTTILLSIEFALFGIMRGTISGSTLLRHGRKDGLIELEFEIDGKNVKIGRTLKKGSSGVNQDAGFIEINGSRTDGTAVELKSKILSLLGYPEELVSKSKSLIFRYTVYTPQEEMKQILYESKEERLEKLRKLFDMDKYKRIKENASDFARNIRSEIKVDSLFVEGISELRKSLENIHENLVLSKDDLSALAKKILENKISENVLKKKFEELEQAQKKFEEMKNQLELVVQKKESDSRVLKNLEEELVSIKKELEKPKAEEKIILTRSVEDISKEIIECKDELIKVDEKIVKARNNIAIIDSKKKESDKLTSEINHLENCPTCKQEVGEKHKKIVRDAEKDKIMSLEDKERQMKDFLEKAETVKKNKNNVLEKLQEEKSNSEIAEQKKKLFEAERKRFDLLKEKKSNFEIKLSEELKKISEINEKEASIKESLSLMAVAGDEIVLTKKSLDERQSEIRNLELRQAELRQIIVHKEQEKERINKEISIKEEKKKELEKKRKTQNWLSDQFINVVDVIEKHVLASIHKEFNQRFQEWFNMLMDDEGISANIDESFAPLVTQNGYENEINNLSGGEKTSIALAYRLALNKVINDFMTTIKTRDLIILDEPTDGFSTDQLDKVREVLDELNSKQMIIVSHEPKMESFVENVIRIRKHEHVSEVL